MLETSSSAACRLAQSIFHTSNPDAAVSHAEQMLGRIRWLGWSARDQRRAALGLEVAEAFGRGGHHGRAALHLKSQEVGPKMGPKIHPQSRFRNDAARCDG